MTHSRQAARNEPSADSQEEAGLKALTFWAILDPTRRSSKHQKDLADITWLMEVSPGLRAQCLKKSWRGSFERSVVYTGPVWETGSITWDLTEYPALTDVPAYTEDEWRSLPVSCPISWLRLPCEPARSWRFVLTETGDRWYTGDYSSHPFVGSQGSANSQEAQ